MSTDKSDVIRRPALQLMPQSSLVRKAGRDTLPLWMALAGCRYSLTQICASASVLFVCSTPAKHAWSQNFRAWVRAFLLLFWLKVKTSCGEILRVLRWDLLFWGYGIIPSTDGERYEVTKAILANHIKSRCCDWEAGQSSIWSPVCIDWVLTGQNLPESCSGSTWNNGTASNFPTIVQFW